MHVHINTHAPINTHTAGHSLSKVQTLSKEPSLAPALFYWLRPNDMLVLSYHPGEPGSPGLGPWIIPMPTALRLSLWKEWWKPGSLPLEELGRTKERNDSPLFIYKIVGPNNLLSLLAQSKRWNYQCLVGTLWWEVHYAFDLKWGRGPTGAWSKRSEKELAGLQKHWF